MNNDVVWTEPDDKPKGLFGGIFMARKKPVQPRERSNDELMREELAKATEEAAAAKQPQANPIPPMPLQARQWAEAVQQQARVQEGFIQKEQPQPTQQPQQQQEPTVEQMLYQLADRLEGIKYDLITLVGYLKGRNLI